jgi:hypothetical protein
MLHRADLSRLVSKSHRQTLLRPRVRYPPRIQASVPGCTQRNLTQKPSSAPPRFSLIPLTIFYSSLTKLFLLFLLTIWRPDSTETIEPARVRYASLWDNSGPTGVFVSRMLEILDEDNLDREWVVRNVMGGMSAGFGLRGAPLSP